jgi:uncharacterized protein YecE (DUF72 family)
MSLSTNIYVGTAGWSVPKEHAAAFPVEGSHLERYAQVFGAVEINSSFYRPHRRTTYERWAASVPETFQFAVKVPRATSPTSTGSGRPGSPWTSSCRRSADWDRSWARYWCSSRPASASSRGWRTVSSRT